MTTHNSTPSRASAAKDPISIYAAWREDRSNPKSADLDALCARHPQLDSELRDLHARYAYVDQLLGASLLGDDAFGEDKALAKDAFEDVIARLRKRRPDESRYEERREIGRGGMGSILELYDVDLRRPLAKKVVRQDFDHGGPDDKDSRVIGRFLEEAQITAQLAHPGVVPVHELGIDDEGRVYFTMDLVRGRTLQQVFALARREAEGWTITRAVGVLERVCETLAYAHSRGVIHRDLKPGNVMVGEFGEVYVMDWGLARILDEAPADPELAEVDGTEPYTVSTDRRDASSRDTFAGLKTVQGTAAGTPGYMAPEQARGEIDQLDARTDVFALGALLYTLLTGSRPYESEIQGDRMLAMFEAMRVGAFAPIAKLAPHASPELASIAQRAMSPDPNDRYPSGVALATDLRAWLEGRVVSAHEAGTWAELRKWVKRNRGLAASIVAVFVAVTGGAIAYGASESARVKEVEREQQIGDLKATPAKFNALLGDLETIWPSNGDAVPSLERWLTDCDAMFAQTPIMRAIVESQAASMALIQESNLDDFQRASFKHTLDSMPALIAGREWIEQRLDSSRSVEDVSIASPEAKAAWAEAIADIAKSEPYGGLTLTPQLGLFPLRKDPDSQLWEFWHVASGDRPAIDAKTKQWAVTPDMGIVMVLIPRGHAVLGTADHPEGNRLFDRIVLEYDVRVSEPLQHEVDLDAFFLSKYEMTQAQWFRVRHKNPSGLQGSDGKDFGAHPVESVSWIDCVETARRLDLALPTEAQWEYATRAGTDTMFFTGQDYQSLEGFAILLPDTDFDGVPDEDEDGNQVAVYGFPYKGRHEPIGLTRANPFGLHDVAGNVWEWCRDTYDPYAAPSPGDGLRVPAEEGGTKAVMRGGSFASDWTNARSSMRVPWEQKGVEPDCGLRLAREIRP